MNLAQLIDHLWQLAWFAALAWLLALIGAAFCARLIYRCLRTARQQQLAETARSTVDWTTPPLSFFKTSILAAVSLGALAAPVLSGAVQDRLRRQQALAIDIGNLRHAGVSLKETPSGFGLRTEIRASRNGVLIRHVNLQDLVALVYGIGQFEVFGGALPWLQTPHYDVRVTGPVHSPGDFDPYSLRQSITDYLSREYGVAIRVNGDCQQPCLHQESFVVERIPWMLSKTISGRR